jgi:hypothetical protein
MNINGVSSTGGISAMSGASWRMPHNQKMSKLFDQIDVSKSGTITKDQLAQAMQTLKAPTAFKTMGADAIFKQLDPNGTGSVSKENFAQGMTQLLHQLRGGSSQTNSQSSVNTLQSSLNSLNSIGTTTDAEPGHFYGTA